MKTILIAIGAALVGAGIMYILSVRSGGNPLSEERGTGPFSNTIINVGGQQESQGGFQTQSFTTKPVVLPK